MHLNGVNIAVGKLNQIGFQRFFKTCLYQIKDKAHVL